MMHRNSIAVAGESAASYALVKLIPSGLGQASKMGLNLALAVDVSGSMNDGGKLDAARQAAGSLVDSLGPRDSAALIAFADDVRVAQGFTGDRAQLKDAVGQLAANGDTALYDAVGQAALLMQALPSGRKVLVVLTDGQDTRSRAPLGGAIAAARDAGTLVFAVGLGDDVNSDVLNELAAQTAGQALFPASPDELGRAFGSIADQLRHQYVLRYRSALPPDDRPHQLDAAVSNDGRDAKASASFTASRVVPVVDLVGLADGDTVDGRRQIEAVVRSGEVARVDLLVDGQPRASATAPMSSTPRLSVRVPSCRYSR
jgi:VWFA-related protein